MFCPFLKDFQAQKVLFISENLFYHFPRVSRPAFLCWPAFGNTPKLCTFYKIFLNFCIKILQKHVKNMDKWDFDEHLKCPAPILWSKYITDAGGCFVIRRSDFKFQRMAVLKTEKVKVKGGCPYGNRLTVVTTHRCSQSMLPVSC